ncbi:MAG TPA: MFS transporter [Planctomycetaceae bacterium]|nr:MFS transporter [Blastopirellula sp.]HAY81014.1 MFS transporter [Planctomycetaceae bacterium]
MSASQPPLMTTRLSIMMFLQFFAWGAWFATLSLALGSNDLASATGGAYESAPIAAIFAPLFLGLIADRFFASEKVMGLLMILGGIIMCAIAVTATLGLGKVMVLLMIAYMCCYMPTLGLSNTIAFAHIPNQNHFPKIRVWGTIGWIVAGLALGFSGWSSSLNIFWLGAVSSMLLGVYSFTLPHTPPPAKGKPLNLRSLLMLDAFGMLRNPGFFVFAVCSTLICIPLGYYYGETSRFLGDSGFTEAASTMTLGQMSEIFFMILIPFFFRKLGVKLMLLIGMASWVLRYVLFAFGAPEQVTWMLLLGVLLHGICYDFFFVTGFMYTDNKAPAEIRGQAQSLLVFLTQGLGLFFGFRFAFGGNFPFTNIALPFRLGQYGQPADGTLTKELTSLRSSAEAPSFLESSLNMFNKSYPENLNMEEFVTPAMEAWKNYWIFPAIMAFAVFCLFAIGFWDKMTPEAEEGQGESETETAA